MMQAYGFSIQKIIVKAYDSVTTGFRGDFIRNMDTQGGEIYLAVDGQSVSLFPEAASYRLPAGMEFKEFKLENRGNTDITVQVAVALGEVGYSALQTSATLDVNIVGGNAAPLDAFERMGYLKPGANSGRYSSSVELVSAASNTKGVIVRTCSIQSWTTAHCGIATSSSDLDIFFGAISGNENLTRPVFLPAGTPLWALAAGYTYALVTWDVLT